jgi:hypothetical protein
VLLPVVYFLGVVTHGRLLPATDDPWVSLAAVGIRTGGSPLWQALLTAGAIVVVINSVLAGVFAGLLWWSLAGPSGPVPLALCAVGGCALSLVSLGGYGQRTFRRDLEASPVAFPARAGDHPATGPAIER